MDGFDPCECINLLSQQARMQRLISMVSVPKKSFQLCVLISVCFSSW